MRIKRSIPGETITLDRKARVQLPSILYLPRPVQERRCDFDATFITLTPEAAREAARCCIHCPDPAICVEACPVNNDIPSAMWLIQHGDFIGAAKIFRRTSSLPEICSQVCPHEALCQGACVISKEGDPVIIGALEAFVMCHQRANETVKIPVGPPTNKSVAIIGSGPAGLSCAEQLRRFGHEVTIYEANPAPGGMLQYGIPNFKLCKQALIEIIDDLIQAGVHFHMDTRIGKEIMLDDLLNEEFDAVFIGVGSGIDAEVKIPGVDLPGIYNATEFLIRANVEPELLPRSMQHLPTIGNRVVVIGGGDTASDCLRTAVRLQAEEVTCLYRRTEAEMPGTVKDRHLAREEGAQYRFLTQPVRFIAGPDGKANAVECLQCELGEPDSSGRRRPVPIEGSNFTVPADTFVLALGYWPDPLMGETTPDLETHNYGLVNVDKDSGQTSRTGVFAAGDGVTGPDLVVTAMAAARKSAAAINEYLQK